MRVKRLPDAEFEIMEYIWDAEPPVTTAQLWEAMGRERGIKIQTTATLLGRLVDSGYLRYERGKGRERFFYPLIGREAYLAQETESFISRYHRNSYASLFSALHRERLSQADLDELSKLIDASNDPKGGA